MGWGTNWGTGWGNKSSNQVIEQELNAILTTASSILAIGTLIRSASALLQTDSTLTGFSSAGIQHGIAILNTITTITAIVRETDDFLPKPIIPPIPFLQPKLFLVNQDSELQPKIILAERSNPLEPKSIVFKKRTN